LFLARFELPRDTSAAAFAFVASVSRARSNSPNPPAIMAEPSSNEAVLKKTMEDPRFVRAEALLKEKRLEEAVVVFEDLLRTM
jgi:hypothetical protein